MPANGSVVTTIMTIAETQTLKTVVQILPKTLKLKTAVKIVTQKSPLRCLRVQVFVHGLHAMISVLQKWGKVGVGHLFWGKVGVGNLTPDFYLFCTV